MLLMKKTTQNSRLFRINFVTLQVELMFIKW